MLVYDYVSLFQEISLSVLVYDIEMYISLSIKIQDEICLGERSGSCVSPSSAIQSAAKENV